MIIYKITNKINGKIYIGQTIRTLAVRWREHCSKKENCRRLSKAIAKYGKQHFKIEQIDCAKNLEELNKKEVEWICKLNSTDKMIGYNIESGGLNKLTSEETVQRLKQRKHPSKIYKNWGDKLRGIKKWSNINYQKPKSEIHRLNISKNCHKRTPVNQYDLQGNLINEFETIKDASDYTGINRNSISACCTGRAKTGRGYIWKHAISASPTENAIEINRQRIKDRS